MKETMLKDVPFGATVLWKERQWVARPASERTSEVRRRLFEVGTVATVLTDQNILVEIIGSIH